jgi:hypothetical protein
VKAFFLHSKGPRSKDARHFLRTWIQRIKLFLASNCGNNSLPGKNQTTILLSVLKNYIASGQRTCQKLAKLHAISCASLDFCSLAPKSGWSVCSTPGTLFWALSGAPFNLKFVNFSSRLHIIYFFTGVAEFVAACTLLIFVTFGNILLLLSTTVFWICMSKNYRDKFSISI